MRARRRRRDRRARRGLVRARRGAATSAPARVHRAARTHASTAGRIEQVLDNLLANALEVSPAGTSIDVTAARAAVWVEIHVLDQGPGMSSDEIARAFDRFWRAEDEAASGSGSRSCSGSSTPTAARSSCNRAQAAGLEAIVRLPVASEARKRAESFRS